MLDVIADYQHLLLGESSLIDLRAPCEFSQGSIPGSINLPLLDDGQREQVGICYKRKGHDAAVALGHQLIQGDLKQAKIQRWQAHLQQYPNTVVYCFRGGERSCITQQWLADEGCAVPRIAGGYKAMRRFLIESIEQLSQNNQWFVLTGMTGSGKTHLLHKVAMSVDLEGIANHRGSSFGRMVTPQPSQVDFENHLAKTLLLQYQQGRTRLIVEDESRLIGRNCIPDPLFKQMQDAPIVVLEAEILERAQQIRADYVDDMFHRYTSAYGEEQGENLFRQYLLDSLIRLRKRLGDVGLRELQILMESAITEHLRTGRSDCHMEWILVLLERYYDPIYRHHLERKVARIIFRGGHEACLVFINDQLEAKSTVQLNTPRV